MKFHLFPFLSGPPRPRYLLLLCGLVFLVLLINGLIEFQRTREGLYQILERQGLIYLESQERAIRSLHSLLSSLEQGQARLNPPLPLPFGDLLALDSAIAEHLMDLALDLDRRGGKKGPDRDQLRSLLAAERLQRIEFRDLSGRLISAFGEATVPPLGLPLKQLLSGSRPVILDDFLQGTPLRPHYFLAVRRRHHPGIILLYLDAAGMQSLRWRWLLQALAETGYVVPGFRYLVYRGEEEILLAGSPPSAAGLRGQPDSFLEEAGRGKLPCSRRLRTGEGDEIFEVIKPLSIPSARASYLRVGLDLVPVQSILSHLKASILTQLALSISFSLFAILVIYWLQNRYLLRMREMEEKVERSERLSALGELAAGVAHEIRNPLNAISIGIQRLKRELAGLPDPEESERLVEVISAEIRRLDLLVERFLGLARAPALSSAQLDLARILRDLVQLLADEAREKGIEVQCAVAPTLPPVRGDPEGIKQAFLNLLKNSLEAMAKGGALRVQIEPFHRHSVRIVFSDTGGGIPASEREKIFQPFYTTKPGGVGLGLSLTHQIIRAHGGEIEVSSEEGKGTTVSIVLPGVSSGPGKRREDEGRPVPP
jgi:signal transduction histidine kinase